MYTRAGMSADFWATYEPACRSISSTRLGRVDQPLGYNVANFYTPVPYMGVNYDTTCLQSTTFLAGISVPPAADHPEVEIGGPNPQTDLTILQQQQEVKRQGPWKEEEHRNFLAGLRVYPWGHWTEIAERHVKTRDAAQIGSHAQKYQHRYYASEKKRRSIHDTTEGNGLPLPVPPPPPSRTPVLTTPPEDSFEHSLQTGGGDNTCALLGYSVVAPEPIVATIPPASPQPPTPNMDNGILPNMDPGLPEPLGGGDNIPDDYFTEFLRDNIDFDVEIPD